MDQIMYSEDTPAEGRVDAEDIKKKKKVNATVKSESSKVVVPYKDRRIAVMDYINYKGLQNDYIASYMKRSCAKMRCTVAEWDEKYKNTKAGGK